MVTTIGLTTVKMVAAGFFLGLGFWASRKLTNLVDEKLFIYDKRKVNQLSEEMGLKHI